MFPLSKTRDASCYLLLMLVSCDELGLAENESEVDIMRFTHNNQEKKQACLPCRGPTDQCYEIQSCGHFWSSFLKYDNFNLICGCYAIVTITHLSLVYFVSHTLLGHV